MRSKLAILVLLSSVSPATSQSVVTSTFTTDNSIPTTGILPSVSFDLTVANPSGVVVNKLDLNCPYVGIAATAEVYTTALGGTWVGNLLNPLPGVWRLRARASIVTAGAGTATPAALDKPFVLAPGTYGMTIVYRHCSARYVGSAATPPTQLVYGNTDITMTMGATQSGAFTTVPNTPRVASLSLYYDTAPVAAATVDFVADVSSGPSPLTVKFTDLSYLAGRQVLAWAWDFDNDNMVDSSQQNPTFVYNSCGDFAPKLTLTTNAGPISRTFSGLVAVDPLVAAFSANVTLGAPPLQVIFADQTTGAPTTWEWDFQSDGTIDSTQQHPVFTFPAGSHSTTLRVKNGCRTSTTTRRIDAVTDTFSTNFTAATNSTSQSSISFFDLKVTTTDSLCVTALDLNTVTQFYNPLAVDLWLTDGPGLARATTPAAWRKVASGKGLSAGGGVATRMELDRPVLLLSGRTYGVAIHNQNLLAYYNNPGSTTLTTPELTFTNVGVATATGGVFNSAPLTPRQWNGTLYFTRAPVFPVAALTFFAAGCATSSGVPTITPAPGSRPLVGKTLATVVDRLPANLGAMLLGFSYTTSPFGPLPVDLSILNMTGCSLHVDPLVNLPLAPAGGQAAFALPIPNNTSLVTLKLFLQALVVDPSANGLGVVTSDAAAGVIGV